VDFADKDSQKTDLSILADINKDTFNSNKYYFDPFDKWFTSDSNCNPNEIILCI